MDACHFGGIRADAGVPALAHPRLGVVGVLLVSDAVESALGEKMRLDEYKQSFVDEAVLYHHQYSEKLVISG